MPISYYMGKPRHGKSYSVVKRVIAPALKSGRKVVTNIPLTDDALGLGGSVHVLVRGRESLEDIARLLFPTDPSAGSDYVPDTDFAGAVFVIDEMSTYCPSGTRNTKIPAVVNAFFTMHGHTSGSQGITEIVLISQDSSQVCNFVKSLIDQSFVSEKTMIGKVSRGQLKIYSGCFGVRSGSVAAATLISSESFSYDPETFALYKSQTMGGDHASESKMDDATNLLSLKSIRYTLPLVVFGLPLLVWFAVSSFDALFSTGIDLPDQQSTPVPVSSRSSNQVPRGESVDHVDRPIFAGTSFAGAQFYRGAYISSRHRYLVEIYARLPGGAYLPMTSDDLKQAGFAIINPLGAVAHIAKGSDSQLLLPYIGESVPNKKHSLDPFADGVRSTLSK